MVDSLKSQPDFHLLFESTPGLYLVLSPGLYIVAVSNTYTEATMTQRDQILGRHLFDVFPDNPNDPAADGVSMLRASLDFVRTQKKLHTMAVQKYDIRRPDGAFEVRYWSPINKPVFNERHEIVYIIHRVEDVTAFVEMQNRERQKDKITEELQRKVETMELDIFKRSMEIKKMNAQLEQKVKERSEELVKAERRYHSIIESMMEGMQIIDREFRYVYANESLERQGGYTSEELLGHTMMEKYPGIEQTDVFKAIRRCMEMRTAQTMETEFRFPDDSVGYFSLSIQPIDEGIFILSTDINERKQSQKALEAQNRMLQIQNRELEQFAYIASHDLQEPLRSVKSFAELLQKKLGQDVDKEVRKYLEFILGSAERMTELIKGLLDYSRIGRTKQPEPVNCNQMITEVLADLAAAIEANKAEVTVHDLPVLQAHAIEMRQLFQNLIGNALKFRHAGIAPRIDVSAELQDSKYWRFVVQDNGIGIDEKYKDKIFIIFQRLHKRDEYGGTGIGLAQCKKIVELHGGEIWMKSNPGNGSTFYFTIPGV
jgi:PAS domain S-box-containing protein